MPFKKPHALYHVWRGMFDRCTNRNRKSWKDYGGRGIKICKRWNSFATFVADMGPRPCGYLLDRIDNDKGYYPGNCRWATRRQQQLNRRVTRILVIGGKRYKAAELAEVAGMKTDSIIERAEAGLSLDEVTDSRRRPKPRKSVCKRGHPFNEENTYLSKYKGKVMQQCRKCHALREFLKRHAA